MESEEARGQKQAGVCGLYLLPLATAANGDADEVFESVGEVGARAGVGRRGWRIQSWEMLGDRGGALRHSTTSGVATATDDNIDRRVISRAWRVGEGGLVGMITNKGVGVCRRSRSLAEAEEAEKAPETNVTAQPEGRKSNWLDWALFAGGDTLVIVGLLGYSGAVNSVNQANAMDFSALDAESTYKKQVAAARSTRTGSAILAVVGAGVAGWGAWRLWGPKAAAPDAPAKSSSWLLPTVAPDAAGLAWGGRF